MLILMMMMQYLELLLVNYFHLYFITLLRSLPLDNPAANAKQSSVITFVGDTVTIVMYASAVSPLSESDITWKLNDIIIVNGDYQNTKRELTISNVEISDAGEYKMSVVLNSGMIAVSATAYTNLTVVGMN